MSAYLPNPYATRFFMQSGHLLLQVLIDPQTQKRRYKLRPGYGNVRLGDLELRNIKAHWRA